MPLIDPRELCVEDSTQFRQEGVNTPDGFVAATRNVTNHTVETDTYVRPQPQTYTFHSHSLH